MKSFLKFVIMANMGDSMDFLITLDQFEGPLDLVCNILIFSLVSLKNSLSSINSLSGIPASIY